MDKVRFGDRLTEGAKALGLALPAGVEGALFQLMGELLKWNAKVNLTAITAPEEVLEKHFLDSLAVLPEVAGAASLMDLGAGAGFPGLPLKVVRPELAVTLVDAVGKKVAFIKAASAALGLSGVKAVHVRAEGHPEKEGLPRAQVLIARAFMDLPDWLGLAPAYVEEGGRIVAMVGRPYTDAQLAEHAGARGWKVQSQRTYALPFSGAQRQVAVFVK